MGLFGYVTIGSLAYWLAKKASGISEKIPHPYSPEEIAKLEKGAETFQKRIRIEGKIVEPPEVIEKRRDATLASQLKCEVKDIEQAIEKKESQATVTYTKSK